VINIPTSLMNIKASLMSSLEINLCVYSGALA